MTKAVKLAAFLQQTFRKAKQLIVVYWDSFAGLIEKPLTSFSWNVSADFGWCPFVVSGSEIQELKYDSLIVWSRAVDRSCEEAYQICTKLKRQHKPTITEQSAAGLSSTVMGSGYTRVTSHLHPRDMSDVFWHQKSRPNFFICQRILQSDFREKAILVQERLCTQDSNFRRFLYTPEMFHVTLCVLSLDSLSQVKKCFDSVSAICKRTSGGLPSVPVQIIGVSSFKHRVVYAAFEPAPQLSHFVTILNQALYAEGFIASNTRPFVPHVTLLKFNRKHSYLRVDQSIIDEFRSTNFGALVFDQLHLTLMGPSRDDDGFYRSYGSVYFHSDPY